MLPSPAEASDSSPKPAPPEGRGRLRHARLASELKSEIGRGLHPVGSSLPTEAELCVRFGVSRHTVREALRRLVELGLVERRQGAGSRVVASNPRAAYVHTLQSLSEVFQYARDTRLDIAAMDIVSLTEEEAGNVPASVGSRWLRIKGVRRTAEGGEAIAAAQVFVHGRFATVLADLRAWTGPVYALIEQRTGETVTEARQVITGGPMPGEAAAVLRCRANTPAIRVLRRYFDASGGPMLTSINWHPADRFTYAMTLRRDSPE